MDTSIIESSLISKLKPCLNNGTSIALNILIIHSLYIGVNAYLYYCLHVMCTNTSYSFLNLLYLCV